MPDSTSTVLTPSEQGLVRKKFNRLTLLSPDRSVKHHPYWFCVCDCGNKRSIALSRVRTGYTKSCGCYRREVMRELHTTHGGTDGPLYSVWQHMRERCRNPKLKTYKDYGGRGITVCPEWEDFAVFRADMLEGYTPGLTLERSGNSGNYSKANCVWETMKVQTRNKRNNKWITHDGLKLCHRDWEIKMKLRRGQIYERLKRGWSEEKSLTTPRNRST